MAVLEIVTEPHPTLHKKAKPVTKVNREMRQLLDDMAETMYAAPGVGLAAPQVGVSKRIIVVDQGGDAGKLYQVINPVIIKKEGWVLGQEGCLSIPGLRGEVYRYEKVQVEGLDRNGHRIWIEADGVLARIFQHEIDHLDGILYTDKSQRLWEVVPQEEAAPEEESQEVVEEPS